MVDTTLLPNFCFIFCLFVCLSSFRATQSGRLRSSRFILEPQNTQQKEASHFYFFLLKSISFSQRRQV